MRARGSPDARGRRAAAGTRRKRWYSLALAPFRRKSDKTQLRTEELVTSGLLRVAIEASPTGMILVDRQGAIVLVNSQVEKLFGYTRQDLLGQHLDLLVPEPVRASHARDLRRFFSEPRVRAMGAGRDLHGVRKDGALVSIEIGLNPLRISNEDFVLSSIVDVTDLHQAQREKEELLAQLTQLSIELEERVEARTAELSRTLRERELLLQEVHHRVKNNLQVVSSLINLQLRKLADKLSRDALLECKHRVDAIALIHEQLYQSHDYARVPFSKYARRLAKSVLEATDTGAARIELRLELDDISLPVDKAIPCALVLTELITNALKHAFPSADSGSIVVELRVLDGARALLAVSDNGIGPLLDSGGHAAPSLGVQLIETLSHQLGGRTVTTRRAGTRVQLTFPTEDT